MAIPMIGQRNELVMNTTAIRQIIGRMTGSATYF